jgi:hypothetical protein
VNQRDPLPIDFHCPNSGLRRGAYALISLIAVR